FKGLFYNRRTNERFILIDTDNNMHTVGDRYDNSYNNVRRPLAEVFTGKTHARSLRKNDATRTHVCGDYPYVGACNTYPAFDAPRSMLDRCGVAYRVQRHIESTLVRVGFDVAALHALARE